MAPTTTFKDFISAYTVGFLGRCKKHFSTCKVAYDFKTFGYDFQVFFEKDIETFATKHKGVRVISAAERKNVFPDVVIESSRWGPKPYAIDLKCANMFKMESGATWKPNRNPYNDLGAVDGFQAKINEFQDTYFFFVKYSYRGDNDCAISVDSVYSKPFYHFVGRARDGLIAYREKDGMMRPCSFDAFDNKPWISSRKEFDRLLGQTIQKRQIAIVQKMIERMPKKMARSVIIRMCGRYDVHPCNLIGKVYNVTRLRMMAKKKKVENYHRLRKEELVAALNLSF